MKKHLCTGLTLGFFMLGTVGLSRATSLILTGIIDGPLAGGTPKAVELYALNPISDLSIYGLGFANNGGGTDGIEFEFPNISIAAGDFLYIASEDAEFENFFGFTPDSTTSYLNINGDDAVELFKNDTLVDVFGNIALDGTGQPWEYLDGWAYRTQAPGNLDPAAFIFTDWLYSGPNGLDGETDNITAGFPFPAGSFSPGPVPPSLPTPEPASIFLLGSGIAGIAAKSLRSRKRHNS
jgi:hypothetical protein